MNDKILIVIGMVLCLLLGFFGTLAFIDTDKDTEVVYVNKTITIPGEKEIIYVDKPIVDDYSKQIFEKQYATEIEDLEDSANDTYIDEFNETDGFEDFLKENITNFDFLYEDYEEDEDESKITYLNLGLNDEEDKLAKVYKEYKIRYELDTDSTIYKATVIAEAIVTYDEDDGFETEIIFSLM